MMPGPSGSPSPGSTIATVDAVVAIPTEIGFRSSDRRDHLRQRTADRRLDIADLNLAAGTVDRDLERGRRAGKHAAVPVSYRCDADDTGGGIDPDPIPVTGDGVVLPARRAV